MDQRDGRTPITVIGGGIAGLVAAISAAEAGRPVRLLEKRSELGGRARSSSPGEFVVNFGPHALYSDGAMWAWLRSRDLLPPTKSAPVRGVAFRWRGRPHRLPPREFLRGVRRLSREEAPSDAGFGEWARTIVGEEAALALAAACVNVTFDHDPGRLSASFVSERLHRIFRLRSPVRYVIGGWSTLVAGLDARARTLGVEISTQHGVSSLPAGPVIVATELHEARQLLADDSLHWHGTRALLLDVGLRRRRGDPSAVFDLDAPALLERFSAVDRSLAPEGCDVIQAHMGLRPDEGPEEGARRLEAVLDASYPGWRARQLWGRRQVADCRTGALDSPGTTWRDRPATSRGGGVFVAGDMMAAEGMLSEVAHASALEAGAAAVAWDAA